jgi:hypothetical protein
MRMDHRGKNNSLNIDLKSTVELDLYIDIRCCPRLISIKLIQDLAVDLHPIDITLEIFSSI